MLYAILCYHDEAETNAWSRDKDEAVLAKRAVPQQRLAARGKLGPVARLMPSTAATTVRAGRESVILDGPFAETKEQLLGFYVVDCETLDEAIGIAQEMLEGGGGGAFEVRPIRTFRPGSLA